MIDCGNDVWKGSCVEDFVWIGLGFGRIVGVGYCGVVCFVYVVGVGIMVVGLVVVVGLFVC